VRLLRDPLTDITINRLPSGVPNALINDRV
jgi:hypothetical protein